MFEMDENARKAVRRATRMQPEALEELEERKIAPYRKMTPQERLTVLASVCRTTALQLEQQQKLCIARLLPLRPDVILMDEPCSALDVEATLGIEELMRTLAGRYTILIVTHNMAQARRVSQECAFMLMGEVIEHARTEDLFLTPRDERTADYVEGRYG